ncbi:MAG: substrate-binding domain-containing protein, partial [Anaerolineae bacterium]|nr:substrate-binding domain-containing protein [Anaerolineae bacterium]
MRYFMVKIRAALSLVFLFLLLTACAPAAATPLAESPDSVVSGKLVLYSGRSEPLIQPVLDAFKAKYPEIEILLKAGSNSELANALIEEQANPQADVFITTELFTVQSLARQGVFQSYKPVGIEQIPAEFVGPD